MNTNKIARSSNLHKFLTATLFSMLCVSCTRPAHLISSINLKFARSNKISAAEFDPKNYCFVADVKASDISITSPAERCNIPLGTVAGSASASAGLHLDVVQGKDRDLSIYAIEKTSSFLNCPDVTQSLNTLKKNKVFFLGSKKFDALLPEINLKVEIESPSKSNTLYSAFKLPKSCIDLRGSAVPLNIVSYPKSSPSQNLNVKRVSGFGDASSIAISNDFAYLATSNHGIVQFDISDPKAPFSTREFLAGSVDKVFISNDLLYVLQAGTLKIFDISDAQEIRLLSSLPNVGSTSMVLGSMYMYVVDMNAAKITSVNVADPENPVVEGTLNLGADSHPFQLDINGNYLFIANGWISSKGFKVIDVTVKSSMFEVYSGDLGVSGLYAVGIKTKNNKAFLSNANVSVMQIDISQPTTPVVEHTLNSFDGKSANNSFTLLGNSLYLNNQGSYVISKFDVSTSSPTPQPSLRYGSNTFCYPCAGNDIVANTSAIYVAAGGDAPGLYALPVPLNPAAGNLSISLISPQGNLNVGTIISVNGTGFTPTSTASMCKQSVAVTYSNSTTLSIQAPNLSAGTNCALTITNADGSFAQDSTMLSY